MRPLTKHLLLVVPALLFSGLIAQLVAGLPVRYDEGAVGLELALRRLPVVASLLHTTAHPDDEDNPLLVMFSRGRGVRTGLLTLTRGDGGQNEIGSELFEELGIIRTEELMTMHHWDGVDQFFSRAYEFGYSFSVEETFERWGREEILSDMVRLIRRYRPDVILCLPQSGTGGGQHHQASAILTVEAFHAAADPSRFPEQVSEGLRPWKAKKLYERVRWAGSLTEEDKSYVIKVETGVYDWSQGSEPAAKTKTSSLGSRRVYFPLPRTLKGKVQRSRFYAPL
jgi:LmbE family N-acetylglucosaminyl deacetylase